MAKGQYLHSDPQMRELVAAHPFEAAHVPALVTEEREQLDTLVVSLGTMLTQPQVTGQAIETMKGHLLLAFLLGYEAGRRAQRDQFVLGISPWGEVLLEDDDVADWQQAGDTSGA